MKNAIYSQLRHGIIRVWPSHCRIYTLTCSNTKSKLFVSCLKSSYPELGGRHEAQLIGLPLKRRLSNSTTDIIHSSIHFKSKKVRERFMEQSQNLEEICKIETAILETIKDQKQTEKEAELLGLLKSVAKNYEGDMNYNAKPVKGTCEWFFSDDAFTKWRDDKGSGVFRLTAGPGCGKSALARTLVTGDHLNGALTTVASVASTTSAAPTTTITTLDTTVCYFFFKDDVSERTKISTALCAVLHQLFSQEPTSRLIRPALSALATNGSALKESFDDLWNLLIDCVNEFTAVNIICVLDALDECSSTDRQRFIDKVERLYDHNPPPAAKRLKFLITSRPYDDIEESFRPFTNRAQYFRFDADDRHAEISHDIELVIDAQLDTFARGFSEADRTKIGEYLKSRGTKTYLRLHLTLEIVKLRPSRHRRMRDVEALLSSLPGEVSGAYEKILNRVSDEADLSAVEEERIMSTLLQIILAATRPLTLDEANYALTLALASDDLETHEELESQLWQDDFKSVVKNICGLIISVYDDRLYFIHLTAREFLLTEPGLATPPAKWRGRFANLDTLHGGIARCCVRYLLLREFSSRTVPLLKSDRNRYPFLEYAGLNWPEHQRCLQKPDRSGVQSARRLCSTSDNLLLLWGPIYLERNRLLHRVNRAPSKFTPFLGWTELAVVSFLGLLVNVQQLLTEGADVNEYSKYFGSALQAAVYKNRESVVGLLLSKDANVHTTKGLRGSPLEIAALETQNPKITQLLLSHGADPLQSDNYHYAFDNTLEKAARAGLTIIFKVLAATITDISTPKAVQAALKNRIIVHSGKYGLAMLTSMLLDEEDDTNQYFTEENLGDLLAIPSVCERVLPTVAKQGKQHLLMEPKILRTISHIKGASQVLAGFLRQATKPCEKITKDVMKTIIHYYDFATFELFLSYSPSENISYSDFLVATRYNYENAQPIIESILSLIGNDFVVDDHLAYTMLSGKGLPHLYAPIYLKYPDDIASNARQLIVRTLEYCRSRSLTPLCGKDGDYFIQFVLKHSDYLLVVDDGLLQEVAWCGGGTAARTFQLLLPLYNGNEIPPQKIFEAVVCSGSDE